MQSGWSTMQSLTANDWLMDPLSSLMGLQCSHSSRLFANMSKNRKEGFIAMRRMWSYIYLFLCTLHNDFSYCSWIIAYYIFSHSYQYYDSYSVTVPRKNIGGPVILPPKLINRHKAIGNE